MSSMSFYNALKIIKESGIVLEKKLRSEMTPEELADARAQSKKRREARKIAAAEKRGYEKAMRDHMTADYKSEPEKKIKKKPEKVYYTKIFQRTGEVGGWWIGKPGKSEYQAFKDLETLKRYFGSNTEALINGTKFDYEDGEAGGPGWKIRICYENEIPEEILEKLKKDLAKGASMSHHSWDW